MAAAIGVARRTAMAARASGDSSWTRRRNERTTANWASVTVDVSSEWA
jgi:hypothetical protein